VKFPAIYNHLLKFEKKLKARGQCTSSRTGKTVSSDFNGQHHWLELDNNPSQSNIDAFLGEKIMYPNMTKYMPFYYDVKGYYSNDKSFFMVGPHLSYLTCLFNSKLFDFCFRDNFPILGGGRELRKVFFEKIPVKKISDKQEQKFRELLLEIQKKSIADQSYSDLEASVDLLLYKLYDLSYEEILAIDPKFPCSDQEYSRA